MVLTRSRGNSASRATQQPVDMLTTAGGQHDGALPSTSDGGALFVDVRTSTPPLAGPPSAGASAPSPPPLYGRELPVYSQVPQHGHAPPVAAPQPPMSAPIIMSDNQFVYLLQSLRSAPPTLGAPPPPTTMLIFHHVMKYVLAVFGNEYSRAQYYVMKKQLETYMEQRHFSPKLKSKILKFYVTRFQSKFFAEAEMIGCMSGQLREDILMHTGRQLVRELNFLKKLPSSLLVQIAAKLRLVIYIAGDIIVKINTIGNCIYFIDRGTVAVYSGSGKELCHLEDGDYFGEIELVLSHQVRLASVVAVTNCELFRLDKEYFDATIAYYPTVYNSIKEVATMRFEKSRVLDEQYKAELRTAKE